MKKTTVNKYLGSYTVSSSSGGTGGAVNSVNGKTGDVVLTKADVGLGNVDNTSDANKPISTATQGALDLKADKATTLAGYGITDVYTKSESDAKFATAEQGAKADTAVQPADISDMLTKTEANTTYAKTSSLATVATSGSYNDLTDKPASYVLPAASASVLGGVKVDGTTITATPEGVISATGSTVLTIANKEALPEASTSVYKFAFLTETSTLVFCDGTAWKQITLTDLA